MRYQGRITGLQRKMDNGPSALHVEHQDATFDVSQSYGVRHLPADVVVHLSLQAGDTSLNTASGVWQTKRQTLEHAG